MQPLFSEYRYAETDKRIPEAAYWAVFSAYKMGDIKKTLRYTYWALKDTAHYAQMLQYLAETYKKSNDTVRYVQTLKDGFAMYPLSPYFYSHLIDYYTMEKRWDEAMNLTNDALDRDSTNESFLLTKSSIYLNLGKFTQSYDISRSLLQKNDTLSGANLNAGLSKYNQGVTLDKTIRPSEKVKSRILKLYKEALPYLEFYRNRHPEDKEKWALPLYTIYLKLNMGEKFDEIDNLIKK